ncbi:MAG: HAMP domain-containing sensor histidine kinase [Porphyromonas sp.]|nr:HAMP domain-containing sensor histidine kinase [Porphyromonas sp.]
MKRWTIWLIIGLMALALTGMLYMQLRYVGTVYNFRNEQFDSAVRQSLAAVNKALEQDEMAEMVSDYLQIPRTSRHAAKQDYRMPNGPTLSSPQSLLQKGEDKFSLDQLPLDLKPSVVTQSDWVLEISKQLLEELSKNSEAIREIVIELAMNAVTGNSNKPLYERITSQQLEDYLKMYMSENKIDLPYVYEVTDRNGYVYFNSGTIPRNNSYSVYTQVLFSHDNPSQYNFLQVYFPGKRQHIYSSVNFITLSIGFTVLLFVLFLVAIVSLFRQKKLEELRNDFISNMTHELKTPVSTIQLGVSMLSDPDLRGSPKMLKKALNSISAESQRLTLLIDKVLRLSFFNDTKRVHLKNELLDVEDLILDVSNIFSLNVEDKGGEIDVDLGADETIIQGDKVHFTNIIYNLMENAIKYRRPEEPPKLSIGTYNEGDTLFIYIQDNGKGIKKEHLDKIFDRFFRVPTGNIHDVKGYGLGLAYVNLMVKLHGGAIKAESDLGRGTKFIISLPTYKEK